MRIAAALLVLLTTFAGTAYAATWEDVVGTGSFGSYGALESEWNYRYP